VDGKDCFTIISIKLLDEVDLFDLSFILPDDLQTQENQIYAESTQEGLNFLSSIGSIFDGIFASFSSTIATPTMKIAEITKTHTISINSGKAFRDARPTDSENPIMVWPTPMTEYEATSDVLVGATVPLVDFKTPLVYTKVEGSVRETLVNEETGVSVCNTICTKSY
jgi:hypothetical protein